MCESVRTVVWKGWNKLMREEMRLVSIGWPLSEALSFCHTMRKDLEDLENFVSQAEKEHRERHAVCVL